MQSFVSPWTSLDFLLRAGRFVKLIRRFRARMYGARFPDSAAKPTIDGLDMKVGGY